MAEFDPVWITTDDQLRRVHDAFRSASWPRRLLGAFEVAHGTPHLHRLGMRWMRAPLAFVASGRAVVGADGFSFVAVPFRLFAWRVIGVDDRLAFDLDASEIVAVETADFRSPLARMYDVPFTRVRTRRPPPLDHFLVGAGARLSTAKVRTESLRLRTALHALHSAPRST